MTGSLEGCRVLVTREHPGELAALLTERGATVIHMPLIAVVDADDDGAELRGELAVLDRYDWLVVTSPAGAARVADAARRAPAVRLAAVGTATARALHSASGRPVDVVPNVQRATDLAAALIAASPPQQRMLVAQADLAAPTLVDLLERAGHEVTAVTAYRTVALDASPDVVRDADAVLFASGSAVESWCRAVGTSGPPAMIAIGPATAAVAERLGLKMTSIAADHSLDGLVTELERWCARSAGTNHRLGR